MSGAMLEICPCHKVSHKFIKKTVSKSKSAAGVVVQHGGPQARLTSCACETLMMCEPNEPVPTLC